MTGITIRRSDGSLMLDLTTKLSQNLGFVDTNSVNGSITIPAPPSGKTSYYICVSLVDTQLEKGKIPGVTISGTTLSWQYSYNTLGWGNFSANTRIYYGYY